MESIVESEAEISSAALPTIRLISSMCSGVYLLKGIEQPSAAVKRRLEKTGNAKIP